MHFKGEVLGVGAGLASLAIAAPALGAPAPSNTLDIGDLPRGSTSVGSFKECAQTARKSVMTDMDIQPTYSWPNSAGESFLTKAGVSLEYSLEPVLDYSVNPSTIRDTASEKFCEGTRTDETKVRVKAGRSSRRIFHQIIRGNASASVQASAEVSLVKICRSKKPPKQVDISRTQITKYREGDKVALRKRTFTQTIPCVSLQYIAVPAQG